jgi:ketosteroid isomerase-like protein
MGRNTELVRVALDAFMRGEVERALEYADPEIVSERVAPIPDPQIYHGIEGVLRMYADWTADFDEFEMDPVEFEEDGDRVVVEMIQRGTGKASGVPVIGRFWLVYTVAGGRITRQDAYLTREQALASRLP